jgi:hypothetical protein
VATLLLIDTDCGRKPLDTIAIRFFHLSKELSGVGRQRFDVSALPFCIECIESEAGLATTRYTRDYYELAAWNLYVNVSKIVGSRALDNYPAVFGRAVLLTACQI